MIVAVSWSLTALGPLSRMTCMSGQMWEWLKLQIPEFLAGGSTVGQYREVGGGAVLSCVCSPIAAGLAAPSSPFVAPLLLPSNLMPPTAGERKNPKCPTAPNRPPLHVHPSQPPPLPSLATGGDFTGVGQ